MVDHNFSFGKNWNDLLRHALDSERVAIATRQTSRFLGLREICHRELGLNLERLNTTSSIGCNEFLFTRPAVEHPAKSTSDMDPATCFRDTTER